MKKTKQLAAVLALATLVGASAFADSRHSNETRTREQRRDTMRRSREAVRGEAPRRNETRNEARTESRERSRERSRETYRNESRSRGDSRSRETYRNGDSRGGRSRDSHRDDRTYRNERSHRDNRSHRNDHSYRSDHSSRNRQPYYARGRVSRVHPHRNGYYVYVHGSRYPFFVPHSHYHRDRFRVGLVIHLGGYYNRGGYYDYYDGRSRGDLYGVVESVDYRRDTFVIRNDATGSFVTVVMRDRRPDHIRPGDYVEVTGDWTRAGVFRAYDVDRVN